MKNMRNTNISSGDRKGEKGAAMVMALLVSFLLLVASAGLLLETSTNTQNVTDTTAEQQAFNAAESGIQAVVHVLRDNVSLSNSNLIVPNPDPLTCAVATTNPELCPVNRIDYLKALEPIDSNLTRVGLDSVPRLSRWMTYSATSTDRVSLGADGHAYSIEVSDPDHTGARVTYASVGKFSENDGIETQKLYGNTTNGILVEYIAQPSNTINTEVSTAANFGSLRLTKYGTGAPITLNNRFELNITMSEPYYGTRVIRGWLTPNTCVLSICTTPNIRFDSRTFTLQGSRIVLLTTGGNATGTSYQTGPPPGFDSQLTTSVGGIAVTSVISGTLSSPEPIRLLIKSTGYGPRGATKRLEAIIRKNFFDGLTAPATLTLIGPPSTTACGSCTPVIPATTFGFALGNSNAMLYSGQDAVSTDIIPPIGAQGLPNLNALLNEIEDVGRANRVIGSPSNISADTPAWLSSPAALDTAVKSLQQEAFGEGRYFANGVEPFGTYPFGNPNGSLVTFCDGNCTLTGDGGGILVVTGTLTLHGRFSFKGLIIVTGQGGVDRRGAGNGNIEGNMVIAPYVNSSVFPESEPISPAFLAPQYDLSGGGSSTIQYNSTALSNGLSAVNNLVLGVVEK